MKNFGISKKERIKSRKEFQQVFFCGNKIFSKNHKLKAIYLINENISKDEIKVAFTAHKKAGKAVWRNRIKRLLRESYRLNKHLLKSNLPTIGGLLWPPFLPYVATVL